MIHAIIAACAAFDLAAGAFDALETVRGLKKGAGLESNSIINFLSGSSSSRKPATPVIVGYNLAKTAAFVGLGFIPNPAFIGGSIGALVASGASHIQGAVKWRYLNHGGQIDRARAYSWWQKLLGMGWD